MNRKSADPTPDVRGRNFSCARIDLGGGATVNRVTKERALHAYRTRAVTERSSRWHESQERLVQRGFFTGQSVSEIGVDLVLRIFEGASLLIKGCVLQIEIHLRPHGLGRSRQFRRQREFHQRGYDCCSQSQFADGKAMAP